MQNKVPQIKRLLIIYAKLSFLIFRKCSQTYFDKNHSINKIYYLILQWEFRKDYNKKDNSTRTICRHKDKHSLKGLLFRRPSFIHSIG